MANHARRKMLRRLCGVSAGLLTTTISVAQQGGWPNRSIRLVVPFGAGGSTDVGARAWALVLSKQLGGVSVVVENRPGAGGSIGAVAVARAAPDGYTLLYSTATTWAVSPLLLPDIGYQSTRDFIPVALTISIPMVVVVSADTGIQNYQDLVARIQAAPDAHSYGSSGIGTSGHITCRLLANRMGVPDLVHIPFKQGGQHMMSEVMSGRVTYAMDAWSAVGPMVRAGRLRAMGTISRARLLVTPDVPTMSELLGETFDTSTWNALWVPTGTPDAIVRRLHDAVMQGRRSDPGMVQQYENQGTPLMPEMSLEQLAEFMQGQIVRWRRYVDEAGILKK